MPETNARIKVCHDTAANFKTNNPTLLVGEWALETDTKKMKIGDGSTAYNALPYSTAEDSDEWRKPDDWIDIRSGALDNSVYFLVGHSSDYQTYPAFSVQLWIEDSGTYDVYIDGIKHLSSVASETISTLNWQTLALGTGFEVTYPSSLITHIVRVTPTNSAKSITRLSITDTLANRDGILWIHFAINNAIRLDIGSINAYQTSMEAITAKEDVIKIATTALGLFAKLTGLKKIPIIDFENKSATLTYVAYNSSPYLKKLYIKNLKQTTAVNQSESFAGTNLEEIVTENSSLFWYNTLFNVDCHKLKKLPQGLFLLPVSSDLNFRKDMTALEDTFFDLTPQTSLTRLRMEGNSSPKNLGVKGVVVSPEAPFDSSTSPQLNVSYTGLSRAALVNLFKSMPYNVGYTVVGTPNIVDGVASGFSNGNYLTLNNVFNPGNYGWEFLTKVKPNFTGASSYIISRAAPAYRSGFGIALGTSLDTRALLNLSSDGSSNDIADNVRGTHNYSADTNYWIKLRFTGTQYILSYSLDDITYIDDITIDSSTPIYGANGFLAIGVNRYTTTGNIQPFGGSIDLNETHIKVNGVTWFNGAATRQLGATISGSLTNTNGIVSGFSNSNFVSKSNMPLATSNWEIGCKANFTYNALQTTQRLLYRGSSNFVVQVKGTTPQWEVYLPNVATVQLGDPTTYPFIKLVKSSTAISAYLSTNGSSYELVADSIPTTGLTDGGIIFGGSTSTPWLSSIDFNNTYIIVDGTKWLRGTEPMAKTVSVVDCAGTADLTANDKAIATGKGWELTVA